MGGHLGVLLIAVFRGGRKRLGGGPGLHPEPAAGGAARAAPTPAMGRAAVGKLRHGGGKTPCTPQQNPSLPLGADALPPSAAPPAGVRLGVLGVALVAGGWPEGTGTVVALVRGWRVAGGAGAVPPLAFVWPGERGGVGARWGHPDPPTPWRGLGVAFVPLVVPVLVPVPHSEPVPAVPARGGSALPRVPAPCPWGGHGLGGPILLGGGTLAPGGPFGTVVG